MLVGLIVNDLPAVMLMSGELCSLVSRFILVVGRSRGFWLAIEVLYPVPSKCPKSFSQLFKLPSPSSFQPHTHLSLIFDLQYNRIGVLCVLTMNPRWDPTRRISTEKEQKAPDMTLPGGEGDDIRGHCWCRG